MSLFAGLVDDAGMLPPGDASAEQAVAAHRGHRAAWYASMVGPLVVPDTALGQVGRVAGNEVVEVSVVISGGAGGLTALARRVEQGLPGVRVVAVESALRDLDDLAGNAGRIAAAAGDLHPDVGVHVELPYAPGWVRAAEEIEAAGLYGKLRCGNAATGPQSSATQLSEQLSVLVEADLSFKATAGRPDLTLILALILALDALIDGSDLGATEELLLLAKRDRSAAAVGAWDEARIGRVRRRLRSFDCHGVADQIDNLVALGLVSASP